MVMIFFASGMLFHSATRQDNADGDAELGTIYNILKCERWCRFSRKAAVTSKVRHQAEKSSLRRKIAIIRVSAFPVTFSVQSKGLLQELDPSSL